MKGTKTKYVELGALLRKGREDSGYTLDQAAMMLGVTSGSYLAQCELGRTNIPFKALPRAIELYGLKGETLAKAAGDDCRMGILEALKK